MATSLFASAQRAGGCAPRIAEGTKHTFFESVNVQRHLNKDPDEKMGSLIANEPIGSIVGVCQRP